MSETQTPGPQDIIEQFNPDRFEDDPATATDFAELQSLFMNMATAHPRSWDEPGRVASRFLRPQSSPADGPRMRVEVDPAGTAFSGTNLIGTPNVAFTIERGRKGYDTPEDKERHGESVTLRVMERDGSVHIAEYRANQGPKLVATSGYSNPKASKALLQEISHSIGSPEELVPAPTRAERRSLLGILGITHF